MKEKVKVYVAHNFAARLDSSFQEGIELLSQCGFEVTSRWIDIPPRREEEAGLLSRSSEALVDCQDIGKASWLILFYDQLGETPGRGKWFEFGLAFGFNKQIMLISPRSRLEISREMVFAALPGVHHAPSLEKAIAIISHVEGLLKKL